MSTMMRFLRLGCKQHPKQPIGCKHYQPKQPKESLFWFVATIVGLVVVKTINARPTGRFEDCRGDDFVGHNIAREKDS